jgi:hypothetical protein
MPDKEGLSGVGESGNTRIFYFLQKVKPTFTEESIRRLKPARYKIQLKGNRCPRLRKYEQRRRIVIGNA